ncbi:MAG: chemotaxis protein CheA [Anaeromyxobacteraceae bacterium]
MADRSQKLSDFLSEAQETIDTLGKGLMNLEGRGQGEPDPEVLNGVFRAAHTLKGLSAMFGVERMTRLAHALEDVLDDLRMGRRALDRGTLDLLLEAPEVFSRIIAEEAEGVAPATTDAAEGLTVRLRGSAAKAAQAGADPLDSVALGADVRGVLTEYEEHRLRANLQRGAALHRVRVSFSLEDFDARLSDLNGRLKRIGEVVSTLPSTDASDPAAIGFVLLFATREVTASISREAGPGAIVEPVPRVGGAVEAPAPLEAPRPARDHAAPPPEAPSRAAPAAEGEPPSRAAPRLSPTGEPPQEETVSLRSVSQAVRVDIRKLDKLMSVVGELVLVKSSLLAVAERLKSEGGDPVVTGELLRANRSLERKLDELQNGILEVRMVPLEQIFDKLARMVRKTARDLGKEIDFEVAGGDVELDKLIVEDLSDPLMHLIRNAIDHAIEAPDRRVAAGKPAAGRVRLLASQRGNHAEIVVEDDGAGIDEERVREVAIERGIATAEMVRDMGRRDLVNLIFAPGFSTAKSVTALSGRGVGLDVVKNNISNLSGIIDLTTEAGRGTRFVITLPLTLAIIRALVASVSGRTYAIPLNSVLEILELRARDVRTLSTREVISLRGSTLPLVRLGRLFGHAAGPPRDVLYVIVVGLAQQRVGIAVDDLVTQQDIVVKALGAQLSGVKGIAGATDLGNRQAVLVLDVGAIIEEVVQGPDALREAVG